MKFEFEKCDPDKILTIEEFTAMTNEWKNKKLELTDSPIAVRISSLTKEVSNVPYSKKFNCHYIYFFPTFLWNYRLVSAFKSGVLNCTQGEIFTMYMQSFKDCYNSFLNKARTNYGTIKEILQTGHSMALNIINDLKLNSFRCFIFADPRNNATTLTLSLNFLNIFFNIFIDVTKEEQIIELPSNIALYIKRDPVIWNGGLQAITHLRIDSCNADDYAGVSPFLFESLNMDVDGDTLIGYIVFNKDSKLDQLYMLKTNMFLNHGMRWSVNANHVIAIFCAMLKNANLSLDQLCDFSLKMHQICPININKLDQFPLFKLFTMVLKINHKNLFGKYNELFKIALTKSNELKYILNFIMMYCDDPIEFQNFIIEILLSQQQIGIENAQHSYCVYTNIIYFTGLVTDLELLKKFITIYNQLPDVDNSLWKPVGKEKLNEFFEYLQQFATSSKQLPLESTTSTMLHNISSFTKYKNNEIYTLDKLILDNVGDVVPISDL